MLTLRHICTYTETYTFTYTKTYPFTRTKTNLHLHLHLILPLHLDIYLHLHSDLYLNLFTLKSGQNAIHNAKGLRSLNDVFPLHRLLRETSDVLKESGPAYYTAL